MMPTLVPSIKFALLALQFAFLLYLSEVAFTALRQALRHIVFMAIMASISLNIHIGSF